MASSRPPRPTSPAPTGWRPTGPRSASPSGRERLRRGDLDQAEVAPAPGLAARPVACCRRPPSWPAASGVERRDFAAARAVLREACARHGRVAPLCGGGGRALPRGGPGRRGRARAAEEALADEDAPRRRARGRARAPGPRAQPGGDRRAPRPATPRRRCSPSAAPPSSTRSGARRSATSARPSRAIGRLERARSRLRAAPWRSIRTARPRASTWRACCASAARLGAALAVLERGAPSEPATSRPSWSPCAPSSTSRTGQVGARDRAPRRRGRPRARPAGGLGRSGGRLAGRRRPGRGPRTACASPSSSTRRHVGAKLRLADLLVRDGPLHRGGPAGQPGRAGPAAAEVEAATGAGQPRRARLCR